MRVYIVVDLEGIAGIGNAGWLKKGAAEYPSAQELMVNETNVAVTAAFEAGAETVIVCDTHAGGGRLLSAQLDPRAVCKVPAADHPVPSLDASFDAVLLLGMHARAGTPNAFLDHTISSAAWADFRINGQSIGEVGIFAACSGHYKVPVVMVSGDRAVAAEAKALLGPVQTVAVKRALDRLRAECLPVSQAYHEIRRALRRALERRSDIKPYRPALPAAVELTFFRAEEAERVARRTGVTRAGPRSVSTTIGDLRGITAWCGPVHRVKKGRNTS